MQGRSEERTELVTALQKCPTGTKRAADEHLFTCETFRYTELHRATLRSEGLTMGLNI